MVTYFPQPDRIEAMVERALTRLVDQPTVSAAWRSLVTTGEVIGIKVESKLGPQFGTRLPVVEGLVKSLLAAGWPATNIIIWDRHQADLQRAGFESLALRHGVQLAGSADEGYDPEVFYESPLLGTLLWGDLEYGQHQPGAGRKSYVSRLLTRRLTRIVVVSPLVAHPHAGVMGLLYSLARASVDNFLRFEGEAERLARAVPEICALPVLGDRVVLCVVDALLCQYLGGSRGLLHYSSELNEIRMSRDPVALDILSLRELERQRRVLGIAYPPVSRELYENAALLELGIGDPARIEVITLHR
ncbi:MAG: DUF362 domain-containing protein [Limisphaera sp.]|nr:DUF362 domain-containing protein [Limisphaera sp.]